MPSTYSNLKIQLMATGENSTTWGNVTNINLGTAIEEAIAGSADVTFASNNQTLTLTDTNATQTARNMRLRCTGTTGGSTRNLVVPTIEKLYLTQNDCADAIVVKTAAGTGVTVPAGKTMWVYVDGTNVVDAVTHLSSLTLATALPVASGGTGANTATDARTSLGLGSISTQNSNSVSITGGSISGITDLAVADGGTGASDAATARTNLGLGSISTQDSNSVTITGGSISGITDLAVADGGTGASDAAAARTNLGATTVGANIFTLTNPAAIRFVRLNADNTVSALSDTDFRTAIGAGTGTVTSVGGTGSVNGITLTGTVTGSGSLTLGGTLSNVSLTTQVTGTLPVANGGTGAVSLTGVVIGNGTSAFTTKTNPSGDFVGTTDSQTLTNKTISGANNTISNINLASQVTGTLPVTSGGTGTATAFTTGSVVFAGASGVYTQDNANLFWDDSNNRLGVGTASPGFPLEVNGEARASKFTTLAGTQSLANATNLTILAVTGVTPRVWVVCMAVDGAGGGDNTVALVVGGNDGSGNPSLVVTQLVNGSTTDVSASGGNIVVQQTTGSPQTVVWSITRIM